ncbi:hypothetical protein Tco_1387676, partial [Tanacetum coccineum]
MNRSLLVSANVMDRSISIDIPVCLGLTLVKQTQFHFSQLRMSRVGHLHGLIYDGDLYYRIYRVCIGILACRGLSLISSPFHDMKSQTPNQVFRCNEFGGVTPSFIEDLTAKGVGLYVADSHTEIDFRSFMMEEIDGEFHFIPEGEFAENIGDSDYAQFEQDEVTLIERTNVEKTQNQRKVRKVSPQASKVASDASDPLDVDSDPDIHGKFLTSYALVSDLDIQDCSEQDLFVYLLLL